MAVPAFFLFIAIIFIAEVVAAVDSLAEAVVERTKRSNFLAKAAAALHFLARSSSSKLQA